MVLHPTYHISFSCPILADSRNLRQLKIRGTLRMNNNRPGPQYQIPFARLSRNPTFYAPYHIMVQPQSPVLDSVGPAVAKQKTHQKPLKASVKTGQLQCFFWLPKQIWIVFLYAVLLSHIQPQTNKTADLCPALDKHNDSSNLSKRRKNLSLSPPVPSWVFR